MSSKEHDLNGWSSPTSELEDGDRRVSYHDVDVFGQEEGHKIKYKTLSWPLVAVLMIAEIVSNGMLSIPSTTATVGLAPSIILIIFLGVFATYTSWLLVRFKLNHPEVHSMGDAGYILLGWPGRELLSFGTFAFAILASGSQLVAGAAALSSLSESKLCTMLYTGIFTAATVVVSFPRTFDRLAWISIPSVISIIVAGIVGMIGAGLYPTPDRSIEATKSATFYTAFFAVTNPVFAYAGHFMFFVLISEMHTPRDAMKAAYVLQGFATSFYVLFTVLTYVYLGDTVMSPSFSSLVTKWQKAAYGLALLNFLVAGALYTHTASKLYFVRLFRRSKHLHENTLSGWAVWTALVVLCNGLAFVLAVGVPIFTYVVSLGAALFASWFTYGIAGFFFLYDVYGEGGGRDAGGGGRGGWWAGDARGGLAGGNRGEWAGDARGGWAGGKKGGWAECRRRWINSSLSVFTILAGLFICVVGLYVSVKGIVDAYDTGQVSAPFSC
ncbi:MAG: hypothetical protein M1828_007504 [Chrysothrix sp. TS-e1954]|nr:MAG: hypothetical protein M1828_007504 [Chrysothrix sp. TS-e1954]